MSFEYLRDNLRISIAQICQTIGYNSAQTISLELLQDILHKFLNEFCRDLRRQIEHNNRTEANLNDVYLTCKNLDINIDELITYLYNVEPVPFAVDLPKFPLQKSKFLYFLDPKNKEAHSRPPHMYKYLPPILSAEEQNVSYQIDKNWHKSNPELEKNSANSEEILNNLVDVKNAHLESCKLNDIFKISPTSYLIDNEGRPTRQLNSVTMTTGGLISTAVDGRTPDAIVPDVIEKLAGLDAPPQSTPPVPEVEYFSNSIDILNGDETKSNVLEKFSNPVNTESDCTNAILSAKDSNCISKKIKTNTSETKNEKLPALVKPNSSTTIPSHIPQFSNINNAKDSKVNKKRPLNKQADNFDLQNEKLQKKRLKMLQKLNTKTEKNKKMFENSGGNTKSKEDINTSIMSLFTPGSKDLNFDKLKKKQSKQKHLKQQIRLEMHTKSIMNVNSVADDCSENNIFTNKASLDLLNTNIKSETRENNFKNLTNIESIVNEVQTNITDDFICNREIKMGQQDLKEPADLTLIENREPNFSCSGIKLSTEPSRSKLNIFKKISKQKNVKYVATAANNSTLATTNCNLQDSPIISLPTGTTITPASPNISELESTSLNINVNNSQLNITSDNSDNKLNIINKPKKRGRKPGSKNQPKLISVDGLIAPNNQNLKMIKGMKGITSNIPNNVMNQEPLNLTNCNGFPMGISFQQKMFGQELLESQMKKRKSRKKIKPTENFMNSDNVEMLSKHNFDSTIKDEVKSINKKLLRMDTILKCSPSISPFLPINSTDMQKTITNSLMSPLKSPVSKKRDQSQTNNIAANAFSSSFPTSFSNMHPNMLSMLPLYAFPPRPGLIPTPGLFPSQSLAGACNSSLSAPSSSGFLPGFMPLTNVRSNQYSAVKSTDEDIEVNGDNISKQIEFSYCNVAPLVTENIKMSLIRDNTSIQEKGIDDRDSLKTEKSVKVAKSISNFSNLDEFSKNFQKMDGFALSDLPTDTSNTNIKIPVNDNRKETACSNEMTLQFGLGPKCDLENKKHITENPNNEKELFKGTLVNSNINTTLNIDKQACNKNQMYNARFNCSNDEPIEVSDDSTDAPQTNSNISTNPVYASNIDNTFHKVPSTNVKDIHIDDFLTKNQNIDMANNELYLTKRLTKKRKSVKNKKSGLLCSITESTSSTTTTTIPSPNFPNNLSLFAHCEASSPVGKLAGGADLIPLSVGTGLAYSAKTIPATSLTATITPSTFSAKPKPVDNTNIFDDVTIIPSASSFHSTVNMAGVAPGASTFLQKKHKKLKKIKDKMKKKKDKKEKYKNKEQRSEKNVPKLQKTVFENLDSSLNKELLRKLKKEKKKDKEVSPSYCFGYRQMSISSSL
ncbi:uncharacterized protein LOC119675201 [Teleopsis dalmanni]|uniref:uncharacterized protein LOC119675201 n=1 Tax=Teleopsis dalmanni TaxID=139649 RepID=UPI0018CDC5AD|nr:uncharacterized protein LOC119675201 [Teleopsis dalmanni]